MTRNDLTDEVAHPRDLDLPPTQPTDSHPRPELLERIAGLADLTTQQLREEWRRLYRSQPPRLSRDLLVRTIAYRIQELAYGGPSKATMRKLTASAKELETNGAVACDAGGRPGTRLVREWHGKLHTVTVMREGFEYAGKRYASLSKIAHAITGAHWSGPRFFGLIRRSGPEDGDSHA
jgi:Protein of unknown function (DUF2924)